MNELHASQWWIRQLGAAPMRARLICLPYAGGNARVFHGWAESLPGIEVLAIQSPGKGTRVLEPPCTDLDRLCKTLLAELMPLLNSPVPYSFFGHSNGALIAFELCCRLQAVGAPMPRRLLLSACGAPWVRQKQRYSTLDDAAFKTMLRDFKATPPEVLEHEPLLDLLLPGLRADFALAEDYACAWPSLRGVVTHVFHGAEDAIPEAEIAAWAQRIELPVEFERMPGGHFFIHDEQKRLLAAIARQLADTLRDRPVVLTH
ncbi:MAG: thioesterase [Lysobacter sp.]|nr:thioesterase [Lysobacter sp.]